MSDLARKASAEMLGTFLLVFIAVGAAVAGLEEIGPLGVALAFGFVLLALAYALGPVSGCHVNPAVTLAVFLRRGITAREAVVYWSAQVLGANAAAKQASEPTERLAVANAGWARWTPVNAAGIAAFVGGGLAVMWGNKGRLAAQEGVARASMAKTACRW